MEWNWKEIAEINRRIENDEEVSEEDCLKSLSAMFDIHPEHLEARFKRATDGDMFAMSFDLPLSETDEDDDEEE